MLRKIYCKWMDFVDFIQAEHDRRKFEKFITYCEKRGLYRMKHSKCNGSITYTYERKAQ